MIKNTTYQTQSGHKIEITVQAQYELDLQGRRKTSGQKVISVTAKLDGKDEFAPRGLVKLKTEKQGCVATIGRLGFNQEKLDMIQEMISEVKAEIKDHNDALSAHTDKLDDLGTGDINKDFGDHC